MRIFLFAVLLFCTLISADSFKDIEDLRRHSLTNIEIAKIRKQEIEQLREINGDNTSLYFFILSLVIVITAGIVGYRFVTIKYQRPVKVRRRPIKTVVPEITNPYPQLPATVNPQIDWSKVENAIVVVNYEDRFRRNYNVR